MVNSSEVTFRKVKVEDLGMLVLLMQAHADFEQLDFIYDQQEERLEGKMFRSVEPLGCFVAEFKNELVGYATFIRQYSTWDAAYYLYLDCLYLEEEYRGMGLGKKMMMLVKEEALKVECKLIQWQTPPFNKPAIGFYNKIGASSKPKERFFWEFR